jgi:Domain of unknown function (DUF4145)
MEFEPKLNEERFCCPHCNVVSQQTWFNRDTAARSVNAILNHFWLQDRLAIPHYSQESFEKFKQRIERANNSEMQKFIPNRFSVATCSSCSHQTLWIDRDLVYPRQISLAPPNSDMDEQIRELYIEASRIVTDSPKGAAALLRLALQLLLIQLGRPGKNINSDIQQLVSDGLSPKIQKALDLLRVVGNNAVHPGQIDFDDKGDVAIKLFHALNFIAEEMITKPKELELLYDDLVPPEAQEQIKKRDRKD